jgi:hypothetical protein
MELRIDNIPTLHTEITRIDAQLYNRIRLGLLRTALPLRLPLTGLRGMDIMLDHNTWICIDRTFYDLPVLAWSDFQPGDRRSLQDPVRCQLHYYHVHADFIVDTVLRAVATALRARAARSVRMGERADAEEELPTAQVIALGTNGEDFPVQS